MPPELYRPVPDNYHSAWKRITKFHQDHWVTLTPPRGYFNKLIFTPWTTHDAMLSFN